MKIDIYQDTVCPWCRIGKRHLQIALQSWGGDPVTIAYHPFFLNPDIPPEGYDFRAYMTAKSGERILPESWFSRPREIGRRVGLIFDFEKVERAPNTLLSHELIALTPEDRREAMIDAVYAAYFEHGQDIGQVDVLVALAEAQGLNPVEIRAGLAAHTTASKVLSEIEAAVDLGITGVPFFVINDRYAFSGAQQPEAILRVLHQVDQETAASR
jgi:predicted DsbA family dithiol-disulfide isomerase